MTPTLLTLLNLALFALSALILVVDRVYGLFATALLLSAIGLLLRDRERRLPLLDSEKLLLAAFCVYPAVVALGMLIHGNWHWGEFANPGRLLLVLPVFLAVRRFGVAKEWFYLGLMAGAVGAGCFGFYQKYLLQLTVAHGHIHKIQFGDISLMLGVLSLTYAIGDRAERLNKLLLIGALLAFAFGVMGSITSGTRGGWIAVPLMMWLILREAIQHKPIRFAAYGLFLASAMTAYGTNQLVQYKVDKAAQDVAGYFADQQRVAGSAGTRFEMWRAAGIMFMRAPLIGVGLGNYGPELVKLVDQGRIDGSVRTFGHAHNDYLHVAAEQGLLGLGGFLLFYALLLRFFLQHFVVSRRLAAAGLLLAFGFIDFGLTQALFKHAISTVFVALYGAVLAGMLCHQRRLTSGDSDNQQGTTG